MSISWKTIPRSVIYLSALSLVIILAIFWQLWRGPLVPAYQLQEGPLTQIVVATGRVISTSRVQIGSEVTGVVTERRVQEGDRVAPGDILLSLRSDEISAKVREAQAALDQLQNARRPQAEAALRQAESQLLQASREAQRRRDLFATQSISREIKEQSEHLENTARANSEQARLLVASLAEGGSEETILRERLLGAKAALDKTLVRSQVHGIILTRNVEPGDLVQPGRVLLEIARSGATEVLVPIDERNLGVLRLGQTAICLTDAYANQTFKARVSFIAPTVDPQRGTVDIRLTVDPVPDYLRQDMTVTVNIETGKRTNAITIPNDALYNQQGDTADIFLIKNHKIHHGSVTLGLKGLVMTEATSGVEPGDWVVAIPGGKASSPSSLQNGKHVRINPLALPTSNSNSLNNQDKTNSKATPVKFN